LIKLVYGCKAAGETVPATFFRAASHSSPPGVGGASFGIVRLVDASAACGVAGGSIDGDGPGFCTPSRSRRLGDASRNSPAVAGVAKGAGEGRGRFRGDDA